MNTRPIAITWEGEGGGKLIGRLTIDGELWASVEWSKKFNRWCIEDAEGRCLTHLDHIHAAEPTKEAAIALAEAMIRDGRMPDPATAKANRNAGIATPWAIDRRQKNQERRNSPAEIAKRTRKAEANRRYSEIMTEEWEAEEADEQAQPLYEALADAFDFADPDLWKSNSIASLRPRLIIHVKRAIATLNCEIAYETRKGSTAAFSLYATNEQRKASKAERASHASKTVAALQKKLDRAREILSQLEGEGES